MLLRHSLQQYQTSFLNQPQPPQYNKSNKKLSMTTHTIHFKAKTPKVQLPEISSLTTMPNNKRRPKRPNMLALPRLNVSTEKEKI